MRYFINLHVMLDFSPEEKNSGFEETLYLYMKSDLLHFKGINDINFMIEYMVTHSDLKFSYTM